MTNAEAWFSIALRPRKPEGSLGRTAQDGHLDSHTAPELCDSPQQEEAVTYYTYFLALNVLSAVQGHSPQERQQQSNDNNDHLRTPQLPKSSRNSLPRLLGDSVATLRQQRQLRDNPRFRCHTATTTATTTTTYVLSSCPSLPEPPCIASLMTL